MDLLVRIFRQYALASALLSLWMYGQDGSAKRYWVYFIDKSAVDVSVTPASLGISQRAMKRRAKVLPADRLVDATDLPVRTEYKALLQSQGVRIAGESRWLNAVSVEASPDQAAQLRQFSSVRTVVEIGSAHHPRLLPIETSSISSLNKSALPNGINYGKSFTQLNNISVPQVHSLGIIGNGVLVGMIDDGFNSHATHAALKRIPVLKEYDWVQADSNTSAEKDDAVGQGDHGCATMSLLGGFENGQLVGVAYGVSMILAKSEYDPSETQIELDHYVEALEWMEREGCDVVSTSLGYDDLDPFGQVNPGDILYSMKDGKTAVTSIAARMAARKGVLLVTAMGNEGWWRYNDLWQKVNGQTGSLVTPADADSIIAVGATYSWGEIAGFSSTGPTADQRIKPEIVTQGVSTRAAIPSANAYTDQFGGTSAATPIAAGAAALILSAHPELTPMQVREAMMQTATHPADSDPTHTATWPNNYYGWGMVNTLEAVMYDGLVFSNRPIVRTQFVAADTLYVFSTWLKSKFAFVADSIRLFFKRPADASFQSRLLQQIAGTDEYYAKIRKGEIDTSYVFFFAARDNSGKRRTNPYNAPDSAFPVLQTTDSILIYYPDPGLRLTPTEYRLYTNFPNPFNPMTHIEFDAATVEHVELAVFNILGERVKVLFAGNSRVGIRTNRFVWDGRDESGRPLPTGVYFYRLRTSSTVLSGKMLLVK